MSTKTALFAIGLCAGLAGCGPLHWDDVTGPPDGDGPPGAPNTPAPTGSKWQAIASAGQCGRTTLDYVLVDEVCGGIDDPHYMDAFHAPIMRDGALLGDRMFAVDASYLWVIDMSDPTNPTRERLLTGFGEPLAVATHAGRLVVAAGNEGLLIVDVTDPLEPSRLATIELLGPALDVFVDGDAAYVATGKGGVAVVDLVAASVTKTLSVPGFAAAVAVKEGKAFVAACDAFDVIDVATGDLVGTTWVKGATKDGVLVAPAKDVAVQGDVAFVAAGRFGAVAVDVVDPSAPKVIGHCTDASDTAFYASGVRVDGDQLFVAAGEWGILPVDVAAPASACTSQLLPDTLNPPVEEGECSTDPPWTILNWTEVWSPPSWSFWGTPFEPGKDPIQTLPAGGLVFGFGDATRIGIRAIDVRETTDAALPKIGRYNEPRLTEGIAARGDLVLVAGRAGGLFRMTDTGLALESALPEAVSARAAALLGDGRWVLAGPDELGTASVVTIQDAPAAIPVQSTLWAGQLAASDTEVFVPTSEGALAIDAAGATTLRSSGKEAVLPSAIAVDGERVLVAAPEWVSGVSIDAGAATTLAPNGVFGEEDILAIDPWTIGLPRRTLLPTAYGLAQVTSFGGRAGLTLHGGGDVSVALPPGDYIAGATDGERAYVVAVDRGTYRSTLVTIALAGPTPEITSTIAFTGTATGVATASGHLYVADGDRGIRVFDASDSPAQSQLLELGGQP